MSLGLYISVPFCPTKCTYCNFASGVFSRSAYENYTQRVIGDINAARQTATDLGCHLPETVDSIYLGGGTPSILDPDQLRRIFAAVRGQFEVARDSEITVECAPGTITPSLIDTLLACCVNRVSLGVQSFVDQEAQAVGRIHKRTTVLEEIASLRQAGIASLNLDLIAGLPHQNAESWTFSLEQAIATQGPHVSVYMLEVDEDSRLGRELIAGGTRYHAHFVPDDEATADFYQQACDSLGAAGIAQYEISNFARAGFDSRHNLKYWTRRPYLGFGVDAHSMLAILDEGNHESAGSTPSGCSGTPPMETRSRLSVFRDSSGAPAPEGRSNLAQRFSAGKRQEESRVPEGRPTYPSALRFSTPDSLDAFMSRAPHTITPVSSQAALEESFFLGLRLNRGVDLEHLRADFGSDNLSASESAIEECLREGLLEKEGAAIRLTSRGRLLSNEVFARFLGEVGVAGTRSA